ncbi:ankyrin repeat domain-containing protein [Candidatus Micrarchaeota archaeon]|nr:ankyrin repeat domain-containing protein [Candidatus Micrarchaeota archaeon]
MRLEKAIAKKALYLGIAALATVLTFKPPLVERAYAGEKQTSSLAALSKKQASRDLDLIEAAKKGDLEGVKKAHEQGADLNAKDMHSYFMYAHGWTPMLYAVKNKHAEVIEYLLENGVDINDNAGGPTPLMVAVYSDEKEKEGEIDIVRFVISKNADVNATSDNGITAPMGAAIYGRWDAYMALVQNGAKTPVKSTSHGDSTLLLAVEKDRWDIVELALATGADINVQDNYGVTPLMKAAAVGAVNSFKMLLAKAADVNLQDEDGWTALIWAVRAVPIKIDDKAVEGEREVDKKLREEKQQARKDSMKIVELLLSSPHLIIDARDESGKTAIDHADDREVIELLKKHGAN